MKYQALIVILILCFKISGSAQSSWGSSHTIFDDKATKVQIQYKLTPNSCQNNRNNFYRYKITGKLKKDNSSYVVYKMDFIDCNSDIIYKQLSFDIGSASGNVVGTFIESMDFSFTGELKNPGYNGFLNPTPLFSKGFADPKHSEAPNGILGIAQICTGESTKLSISGGKLGEGAKWNWYTNTCGESSRIGTGDTISVSPSISTTYFARAEGGSNTTECVKLMVTCFEPSTSPSSISSNKGTTICEGTEVILKVNGGKLSSDANWNWYTESCDGTNIGSGPELSVRPESTITYYVRSEGHCNITNCISITINVIPQSVAPYSILAPSTVKKNKKFDLSVYGGELGSGAQWEWYENSCDNGKLLGTGDLISLKASKPTTYFVKAVGGECNETTCINTFVTPERSHHFHNRFTPKDEAYHNKFLHIGFGLGIERFQFNEYCSKMTDYGNGIPVEYDTVPITLNGLGLETGLSFHPYITNYVSVGFEGNYSIGIIAPLTLLNNQGSNGNSIDESYFYTNIEFGAEVAAGCKAIKLLGKFNRNMQTNDYQRTILDSYHYSEVYTFKDDINKEIIASGLRFAGYSRKTGGLKGNSIDLTYTLTREFGNNWNNFGLNDYHSLSDWNVGFGFMWWRQNAFKFKLDVSTHTQQKNISQLSYNKADIKLSLFINSDWFY